MLSKSDGCVLGVSIAKHATWLKFITQIQMHKIKVTDFNNSEYCSHHKLTQTSVTIFNPCIIFIQHGCIDEL